MSDRDPFFPEFDELAAGIRRTAKGADQQDLLRLAVRLRERLASHEARTQLEMAKLRREIAAIKKALLRDLSVTVGVP